MAATSSSSVHCTLQRLLAISQGPTFQHVADEGFAKLIILALPANVRATFFPTSNTNDMTQEERDILLQSPEFFRRGAIHYLMQVFGEDKNVDASTREHIDTTKAATFWKVCASFLPPTQGEPDPVVTYGWDRERDKALLARIQGECTAAILASDQLAYRRATPELLPYLARPVQWYNPLANYLQSEQYLSSFLLEVAANSGDIRARLFELSMKLNLLKRAAGADGVSFNPLAVIAKLCSAIEEMVTNTPEINDETKAAIREMANTVKEVRPLNTSKMGRISLFHDYIKLLVTLTVPDPRDGPVPESSTVNVIVKTAFNFFGAVYSGVNDVGDFFAAPLRQAAVNVKKVFDREKYQTEIWAFVTTFGKEMGLYKD